MNLNAPDTWMFSLRGVEGSREKAKTCTQAPRHLMSVEKYLWTFEVLSRVVHWNRVPRMNFRLKSQREEGERETTTTMTLNYFEWTNNKLFINKNGTRSSLKNKANKLSSRDSSGGKPEAFKINHAKLYHENTLFYVNAESSGNLLGGRNDDEVVWKLFEMFC